MARVTVEDCVIRIPNRFELVMLASQRARDISAGAALTVEEENDKHPVIALREIADETVTPDALTESLVRGLQRHAEIDEPDDEPMQLPDADSAEFGEAHSAARAEAEREFSAITTPEPAAKPAAGSGGGE